MNRTGLNVAAHMLTWLCLSCPALAHAGWFGPDCDESAFNESSKAKHVDQNSSFSVSVPKEWSVKSNKEGSYSELLIKASGSCKITILITSRLLENKERALTPTGLIDAMLQSSLQHLRSQGHQIIDYGKYKDFEPGWPAYVIVSRESDGKRAAMSFGTVVKGRNAAITALTRNEQHSDDLSNILRHVIDSVEIY